MNNVYRQVELFYEKHPELPGVVARAAVERYLRELAWQGKADAELRQVWAMIAAVLSVLDELGLDSFAELSSYDYQAALYNYADTKGASPPTESLVTAMFAQLEDFLRRDDESGEAVKRLRAGRESFYERGRFTLPERPEYDEVCLAFAHIDELTEPQEAELNDFLNNMVTQIKLYFQDPRLSRDLQRAMTMFLGPTRPEDFDINDAMWYNFWDYFLFDYHMLRSDLTPLRYYQRRESDRLSPGERFILRDLLAAKFTVFYVNGVADDILYCTNLLTDEPFELPCPDRMFSDPAKVLLIGHISPLRAIILQYITAVTATPKMRRRIKEELLLLHEIYRRYQVPGATLEDFLSRHAGAMRHALLICSNTAQLRPTVIDESQFPPTVAHYDKPLPLFETFLYTARKLGFSAYSLRVAKRLYGDYLAAGDVPKPENLPVFFAAVLILVEAFNGVEFTTATKVAKAFRTSEVAISQAAGLIIDALLCQPLDPRYMTEEGRINALYLL